MGRVRARVHEPAGVRGRQAPGVGPVGRTAGRLRPESGILVFKLSEVEQFQVMTRRRAWPQQWARKDQKGRLAAGEEIRALRSRGPRCPWGHSRDPLWGSDARVFPERGGVGRMMPCHSFIMSFVHSFLQEVHVVG